MSRKPSLKLFLALTLNLIIILSVSCESDPNIMNDDAEETLFIWGYADMNSGHHKLRIRRAILEEGPMGELAKDPNLILPQDPLSVNLILWENEEAIDTLAMNPVVYPKEDGNFASEQNIIHEAYIPLAPSQALSVFILNEITGDTVTSPQTAQYAPSFTFPYSVSEYGFDFIYNFHRPDTPFHIEFPVVYGLIHKMVMEIKYVDILNSGDTVFQKAIFQGNDIIPSQKPKPYKREFSVQYLYNIMNKVIPENADVKYRSFYRFQFKSLIGSKALSNYLHIGDRFSDNRKLAFSNVTGPAIGIFYATHYTKTDDIKPASNFPKEIATDERTAHLKFAKYLFSGTYVDPDKLQSINW